MSRTIGILAQYVICRLIIAIAMLLSGSRHAAIAAVLAATASAGISATTAAPFFATAPASGDGVITVLTVVLLIVRASVSTILIAHIAIRILVRASAYT
jgi:hypothetical protein